MHVCMHVCVCEWGGERKRRQKAKQECFFLQSHYSKNSPIIFHQRPSATFMSLELSRNNIFDVYQEILKEKKEEVG